LGYGIFKCQYSVAKSILSFQSFHIVKKSDTFGSTPIERVYKNEDVGISLIRFLYLLRIFEASDDKDKYRMDYDKS
jgi:hypothetical protein